MIVDGIAYTFGIFLNEFADYFQEGPGKVAWVGSLLSGMYLTAGKWLRNFNFSPHKLRVFHQQVLSCLLLPTSLVVELSV
jgi:hypothetical protein